MKAKRKAATAERQGLHWPNTTRAMQTQPRPEMTPKVKALNWAMERKAPPTAMRAPDSISA